MTETNNKIEQLTVATLFAQANHELEQEDMEKAKVEIKAKLKERRRITKMLANCDREIEELKLKYGDELGS